MAKAEAEADGRDGSFLGPAAPGCGVQAEADRALTTRLPVERRLLLISLFSLVICAEFIGPARSCAARRSHVTTVPVRKPNRQDFVRVNSVPAYSISPAAIIELKEDRETYLVTPDIARQIPGEFGAASLYTTINRQGVLHVWPVKLPGPDGKHNEWHRSAAEAAERAMQRWVRVTANMSLGAYEISEAVGALPAPEWPDLSFPEILEVAFRGRIVNSLDHPLIQRLRGAA